MTVDWLISQKICKGITNYLCGFKIKPCDLPCLSKKSRPLQTSQPIEKVYTTVSLFISLWQKFYAQELQFYPAFTNTPQNFANSNICFIHEFWHWYIHCLMSHESWHTLPLQSIDSRVSQFITWKLNISTEIDSLTIVGQQYLNIFRTFLNLQLLTTWLDFGNQPFYIYCSSKI